VGAVGLFLRFRLVLPLVWRSGVRGALIALVGQGNQAGCLQLTQDTPDPRGLGVMDGTGQRPGDPDDIPRGAGDDLQVHPVPAVLA
jgi:hypothetical protein